MDEETKVFVITGSTKGIGAATAELLAGRGAKVVITGRNEEQGRAREEELRGRGLEVSFTAADVSRSDQLGPVIDHAVATYGGLDVLVNNAATSDPTAGGDGTVAGTSEEVIRRVLDTNLIAPWILTQLAVPHLAKSENGSVINIVSVSGFQAYPGLPAYGTSKAALINLTKYLAMMLAPQQVRVNACAPDQIATDGLQHYLDAAADPEAAANSLLETNLTQRFGEPIEIAEMIGFLASDKARYITGQTFTVDGGSQAWRGKFDEIP